MGVNLFVACREIDFFSTTQIEIRIWNQNVSHKFTNFFRILKPFSF